VIELVKREVGDNLRDAPPIGRDLQSVGPPIGATHLLDKGPPIGATHLLDKGPPIGATHLLDKVF
jgi:hypothetical protein